jgi:hypothetical protein
MTTAIKIIPLLRPDELDRLASDYERAAAVSLAGSTQTRDWPATLNDLLAVAFAIRDLARRLRERPR